MAKEKKRLSQLFKYFTSRQAVFYLLAAVLFLIVVWFVIANFLFLVNHMNTAFGTDVEFESSTLQFDRAEFERLNLISER